MLNSPGLLAQYLTGYTANICISFTTALQLKVVTLIKATTENSYLHLTAYKLQLWFVKSMAWFELQKDYKWKDVQIEVIISWNHIYVKVVISTNGSLNFNISLLVTCL